MLPVLRRLGGFSMSHFVVAVLSHTPEDVGTLLAPYCESTEDPEYLEFEEAS